MFKSSIFLLIVTVLVGCAPPNRSARNSQATQIPAATSDAIDAINSKLAVLDQRMTTLENTVSGMDVSVAAFDPTEPGPYQYIHTNAGDFMVSLHNVAPYLDGQKVTLDIGNPQAAQYNGVTLNISWAPRQPDKNAGLATTLDWYNKIKSKTISITTVLLPGHWNRVSFVIAPAKSDDFGYLTVSITANEIRLYQ